MNILIISDIHENFHNLEIILTYAKNEGISRGFALGDLINPGIMHQLGRSKINFDIVLGNNDGDKFMLAASAGKYKNLHLEDLYEELEIDEKKIFITHYDKIGDLAAKSGDYQATFCGHNHVFNSVVLANGCLLANPGEVSGHMFGKPTFGVWDSITNRFKVIQIAGAWVDVKRFKRDNQPVLNEVSFTEIASE